MDRKSGRMITFGGVRA